MKLPLIQRTVLAFAIGLGGCAGVETVLNSGNPSKPAEKTALSGTRWMMTNYDDSLHSGILKDIILPTVSLNFDTDSTSGGNDGCNSYGASYRADKSAIQFSGIISTEIACKDQIPFLDALQQARSYSIDGTTLNVISNHFGMHFMTFERR